MLRCQSPLQCNETKWHLSYLKKTKIKTQIFFPLKFWLFINTVNGLFSNVEGLREQPWTAWKRKTAALIHRSLQHEPGRSFFVVPGCLPLHLWDWSVSLRGLTKQRKSLMSGKIISVYESSSDFPQIPFHSGKEWMPHAEEWEKTINETWQLKHPVGIKHCRHTLRTEPMLDILPGLLWCLSLDNEMFPAYCITTVPRQPQKSSVWRNWSNSSPL